MRNEKLGKIAAVTMMVVMAMFAPSRALLAQTGAVVTSGAADIARAGNVTNINQATDRAAINWQTFNIRPEETVNFNQPGVSSVTLNRVIGNERSVLEGALNANGNVFLLNSSGVLIAGTASVNVGGFLASSLNLTDDDLNAGSYIFQNEGDAGKAGAIINQGAITTKNGGYAVLLGGTVSNQGIITATKGAVALASGDKIRLNLNGDSLLGVIIDEGALSALVENRNAIIADGGQVFLTAKAAGELLDSRVNTSGIIQARTIGELKGHIEVYAHGGTANISGTLDASAPDFNGTFDSFTANRGDGGFIETSGNIVKISDDAIITTRSANGANGEWLIDPDGFTVGLTANDGDMSATALNKSLANSNIEISSTTGGGRHNNDGNININGAVNWSQNTLTLNATNNIYVNNVMTATGNASLTANYGSGKNADETPMGIYTAVTNSNARIDFSGTGALRFNNELYAVINTAADLSAARNNPNGRYALGSNINMSSISNWTSLDNKSVSVFTGRFNGLGHQISGFTGSNSLFGNIGEGATVSNLTIYQARITAGSANAKMSVGILADVNHGSVMNTHVTGIGILDAAYSGTDIKTVGGLVGINYGLIARSSSTTAVRSVTTAGGLVGVNESAGRIIESWASGGSITAGTNVNTPVSGNIGGLVGVNNGNVRRSYASNSISLDGRTDSFLNVGGFVGKNAGNIEESYTASGALTDYNTAPNFGGFVGENTASGVITNAYSTRLYGYRTDVEWSAGFVYNNAGVIRNAYAVSSANNRDNVYYGFARNNTGVLENIYWSANSYGGGADLPRQTVGTTFLTIDAAKNFSAYNFGANVANIWGASQSGHPILRNIPVYIVTSGTPAYYGQATSNINSLKLFATGLQGGGGDPFLKDDISGNNSFTVTATGTGGYLDAGAWNAADVLNGVYTDIKGVVRVDPKPLTISGVVENRVYDGTTNVVLRNGTENGGLVGLIGNQTLNIVYTSAAFRDGGAGNGKVVDIAYDVSDGANGGKTGNYVLSDVTHANIAQKPVDVVVVGNNRNYDGTTDATANIEVVSGVIAGDILSVSYASAVFDNKNVGNRNITVSGITLGGADANNYTLGGADSVTSAAAITPLPLTLYGIVDEGSSLTVGAGKLDAVNIVDGDSVTLNGSVKIASSTAGAQPIIDFSGLIVGNPNYTVVGSVGSVIVGNASLVLDSVTAGAASVNTSGKTTTVTQTSDQAIIDWLRFSLAADENLTFVQPSETSIVLNRVVTNLPGVIEGALKANGRVFILNGGGVLFTANSSVNVGALLAGTFNLTNENFLNGNYVFTVARGGGTIISEGDIVIADGGFVALASGQGVRHTGTITGGDMALLVSTDALDMEEQASHLQYTSGNLTGSVAIGGAVNLGSGGTLDIAGDTVALSTGFMLDTGSGGAFRLEQNSGFVIGDGGILTGAFVMNNLAARNVSFTSRMGDITLNAAIDWSSNSVLSFNTGNDIYINKSIKATGAGAGLSLTAGGDYRLITPATFSGAVLDTTGKPIAGQIPAGTEFSNVSLSGANASLKINDNAYTLIHNMDDLAAINGKTGWFALAGDIDASTWSHANTGTSSVVGMMAGTLAGLGHTIGNLTLNAPGKDYVGLIGEMPALAGTANIIRDIGVVDVDIAGNDRIGALAGATTDLTVSHAYSTGKISGNMIVGGLIGLSNEINSTRATGGTRIKNSHSAVNITAASGYLGGLLGSAYAVTISDSHAVGGIIGTRGGYWKNETTGEIVNMLDAHGVEVRRPNDGNVWTAYIMPSNNVGGLVGQTYYGNIDNSYATGNISTIDGSGVGGLIGSMQGTNEIPSLAQAVTNSFATGNVVGGTRVGGLMGDVGGANQGGNMVYLDNVYATGDVIGMHESSSVTGGGRIGGLIGNAINVSINNAFATGNVITNTRNPSSFMGGLLGYSGGAGSVTNSFATGTVVGNSGNYTGGLIGGGSENSAMSDSYYSDAAYQAASESAPARSEAGMITSNTQASEANKATNTVNNRDGETSVDGSLTDQYILYGDSDNYSARVRAVSVESIEDEECYEDEECN